MAALVLTTASCKKDAHNLSKYDIKVSDIKHSECLYLPHSNIPIPDSVNVSYNDGTVHVTHYCLMVNCDFEEVLVNVTTSGDTIRIKENGEPSNANCICNIINEFDIENVPHGTYVFVFENWAPSSGSNQRTFTF